MIPIERIDHIASIIAAMCLMILIVKFITKRLNKKQSTFFKKINIKLMKTHKSVATILIVSAVLHGILSFSHFSQVRILPYIMGTICLLSCIASAACFYIKKRLKNTKSWILYHNFFAVIALVTLIGHIALSR